jgi:uncharacterized protein (TIGR03067 family)
MILKKRITTWTKLPAALLCSVLAWGACVAQETSKGSDWDASKLYGQWKYTSGMRAGNPASDESLASSVTISDKEFTLGGANETFVMAYQFNGKKSPAEIDFTITAGPVPEGKALGIIKLSGDKLTLCYDPTATKRPDKFESNAENGWHLFELARKGFDANQLIGKWKYESGERAGEQVDPARLQSIVTISKDKFVVPAGPDAEFVMPYKIDDRQQPIAIDLTIESGPAPEGKAAGIIKLENGKLTLCYDPMGGKRPTEFKTTSSDGCFMFVMVKQADDDEKKDHPKSAAPASTPDKSR